MKLDEVWTSEVSPRGYRIRVALPASLVVSIETREALTTTEPVEGGPAKIVGHHVIWRTVCQVAAWFPMTRVDADRLLGTVLELYDPDLRKHLEKATAWLDELGESAAPPAQRGPGSLN